MVLVRARKLVVFVGACAPDDAAVRGVGGLGAAGLPWAPLAAAAFAVTAPSAATVVEATATAAAPGVAAPATVADFSSGFAVVLVPAAVASAAATAVVGAVASVAATFVRAAADVGGLAVRVAARARVVAEGVFAGEATTASPVDSNVAVAVAAAALVSAGAATEVAVTGIVVRPPCALLVLVTGRSPAVEPGAVLAAADVVPVATSVATSFAVFTAAGVCGDARAVVELVEAATPGVGAVEMFVVAVFVAPGAGGVLGVAAAAELGSVTCAVVVGARAAVAAAVDGVVELQTPHMTGHSSRVTSRSSALVLLQQGPGNVVPQAPLSGTPAHAWGT